MRKVIVLGGSAGGIQALCSILKVLPSDFPAALLAVIHTSERSRMLPEVLSSCCRMKVSAPAAAEPIHAGHLYIAGPNRHLVVRSHCAVSWLGPRENRHRPAVDPLFRTAARAYRSHVIGVVLSGALDDASAGAMAIKARGGTVVVQDPADAQIEDMPANVLKEVDADYCLPARDIAALLARLVVKGRNLKVPRISARQCAQASQEVTIEMNPAGLTCPDCGGVVLEIKPRDGRKPQFKCHVGHNFSLASFSEAHADALERALWMALRKLNEQKSIQETLANCEGSRSDLKKRYLENADAAGRDMKLLHEILARL